MSNTTRTFPFSLCLLGAIPLAALGGCGLFTPDKDLFVDDNVDPPQPSPAGIFEQGVVTHVRCEIRNGLWKAVQLPNVQWLWTYGTTVTLKLQVEEQSGVNPGVSLTTPLENSIKTYPVGGNVLSGQSFSLGLGGAGTAHSTRVETITFTLANKELLNEAIKDGGATSCAYQHGVMIQSDLKIGQFIYDKAVVAGAAPEATTKSVTTPPYSQFQEELTFVASFGGNVTPTWKFARITSNSSSPLLTATRTNTNYLEITLGPVAKGATGNQQTQLTADTKALHNAALTGSATASQIAGFTR
jgi:hypothetical protein